MHCFIQHFLHSLGHITYGVLDKFKWIVGNFFVKITCHEKIIEVENGDQVDF